MSRFLLSPGHIGNISPFLLSSTHYEYLYTYIFTFVHRTKKLLAKPTSAGEDIITDQAALDLGLLCLQKR